MNSSHTSALTRRIEKIEQSEQVQRVKRPMRKRALFGEENLAGLPDGEREECRAFLELILPRVEVEDMHINLRALTDDELATLHQWADHLKEIDAAA